MRHAGVYSCGFVTRDTWNDSYSTKLGAPTEPCPQAERVIMTVQYPVYLYAVSHMFKLLSWLHVGNERLLTRIGLQFDLDRSFEIPEDS